MQYMALHWGGGTTIKRITVSGGFVESGGDTLVRRSGKLKRVKGSGNVKRVRGSGRNG